MAKHRKASRRIHEASLSTPHWWKLTAFPVIRWCMHRVWYSYYKREAFYTLLNKKERIGRREIDSHIKRAKGKRKLRFMSIFACLLAEMLKLSIISCSIFNEKLKHEFRNNIRISFLLRRFQSRQRDYFAAHNGPLNKLCYCRFWEWNIMW